MTGRQHPPSIRTACALLLLAACRPAEAPATCGAGTVEVDGRCVATQSGGGAPRCGPGTRWNGIVCVPARDGGEVSCGPGTVRVESQCRPALDGGGEPDAARDAAVTDAGHADAATDAGHARDAGTDAGGADAGSVDAGSPDSGASTARDGGDAGADAGGCPAGTHACGDTCASDDDVAACGPACLACSAPPVCHSSVGVACVDHACSYAPADDETPCSGGTCCAGACANLQTDVEHCGACGNACAGRQPRCRAGRCVEELAELGPGTSARKWVAVAAGQAWVATENAVLRVALDTGQVDAVLQWTPSGNAPQVVADDAEITTWVPSGSVHKLVSVSHADGGVRTLLDGCLFHAVDVDATHAFASVAGCLSRPNAVVRVPRGGGTPLVVASSGSAVRIHARGNLLTWRGSNVQGAGVYYVNKDGSGGVLQAGADAVMNGVLPSGGRIHWFGTGISVAGCLRGTALRAFDPAGSQAAVDVVTGLESAWHNRQEVRDSTVWWDDCSGTTWRLDLGTLARTEVLRAAGSVVALTVDATHAYVVEAGSDSILRLVRAPR